MSASVHTRHRQVQLPALLCALTALVCVYLVALAAPAHLSAKAVLRTARELRIEVPRALRLYNALPCVPPDWPVGVVHPHIFIVGHSKTGSTYMHAVLAQHPNIAKATQKEINFFPAADIANPMQVYATYFPNRSSNNPDAISLDASISYCSITPVRDMLFQTFPCAKIIFLMRDPTVRWWSSYNHNQRKCRATARNRPCTLVSVEQQYAVELNKTLTGFTQVGFTEEVQKSGVSFFSLQREKLKPSLIGRSTLTNGMYYSRIIEWLDVWPRSQLLLVNTEEYFDPEKLNDRMRVITDFVGLKPFTFTPIAPKLPGNRTNHKAPGDYGPLPEPYYSKVRAFYQPDLELLKKHFGISFNATTTDDDAT